jgi:hypothetical protein
MSPGTGQLPQRVVTPVDGDRELIQQAAQLLGIPAATVIGGHRSADADARRSGPGERDAECNEQQCRHEADLQAEEGDDQAKPTCRRRPGTPRGSRDRDDGG